MADCREPPQGPSYIRPEDPPGLQCHSASPNVASTRILRTSCHLLPPYCPACVPAQVCGSAINWAKGAEPEATLATTGLRLGSTDKTAMAKRQSTVCKVSFLQQFKDVCQLQRRPNPEMHALLESSYRDLKMGCASYVAARAAFLQHFDDWVCNSPSFEAFK